jgi:enoyl-CoA hydratase/carnithine racemase
MISIRKTGAVAIVTYDRGERRNALSVTAMQALTQVARDFQDDTTTTCVVLTGTKAEFSAGVDLKDPARWEIDGLGLDERRHVAATGLRLCKAWDEMPQLTVAAIEGLNVGGGIALALACDWRVMGESAFLLVPEIQKGITLGWQALPRLINLVGPSRAKQIILLGERMAAACALKDGLVDWVCPDGLAEAQATDLALRVAGNPAAVVKMTKQAVNAYANALAQVATFADVDQALVCNQSAEAVAARAGFAKG